MVGVPGKYKGCETCRARRVKCGNERPKCKKCIDSGRDCAGYQRQMVFIMATPEDGGRCSSHPPRRVQTNKKGKSKAEDEERLELIATEPLAPAWDDLICLTNHGVTYVVQIAALHTKLQNLVRDPDETSSANFTITLPSYSPMELQAMRCDRAFHTDTQCMVHLSQAEIEDELTDSLCVFLFDHNSSTHVDEMIPPWKLSPEQLGMVRQLGPEHFRSFPAHHVFVRVYRHSAVSMALFNREDTFLSSPEWSIAPWEFHPKSLFDRLFDVIVLLPSLFSRADRIAPNPPTLARRLRAQDLLANCLNVERLFDEWHRFAGQATETHPQVYWIEELDGSSAGIPFVENFAFKDGISSVMFLYYWMANILFHHCIEGLHQIIFQPVIEDYPNMYPDLPASLQINTVKYQQRRELAANICRALDFALSITVQPDMLVAPLTVAHEFYKSINASSRDGELEIMWCENFRLRLVAKGQDIADVLQSHTWAELGRF